MIRDRFLLAAAAVAALLAPLMPGGTPPRPEPVAWPASFEGRPLVPMVAAAEDARLAQGFPGSIARFSDGDRQIVLRHVTGATRQLHPAADCFRAIGYSVSPLPMAGTEAGGFASCFEARRNGASLRICERVTGADGRSFPDISSWYWPALLGRSRGPWLAATIVERLPE